jgi:hypothetical protein
MARKRGGWAAFVIKWLVIPAVLAVIGFFVIGPRLGNVQDKVKTVELEPLNEDGTPIRRTGNPKVEISAQKVTQRRSTQRRTETSESTAQPKQSDETASPQPEPSNDAPSEPSPEPEPPADPAGGGTDGEGN